MSLFGFNGRFLRVHLDNHHLSVEEPPLDDYQRYLGGRGFIATTLLRELDAEVDPLGPKNKLIFALGPFTGMPLAGSGRNSVGAKSPMTGIYGESEAGGFWGAELKRAGFDAVILEGISTTPVYLWIRDGHAELRDASHLWGKEVAETHFALREETGDPKVRTAVIGPAGERLVRMACICNDITHVAGRMGLGAVMGSKNLKGIAVRGHTTPPMADPQIVRDLGRWMAENFREKAGVWKYGTGYLMEGYNLAGNLPTRNFRDGIFDGVSEITAQRVCDLYRVEMYGCYACPIRCKKRVRIEGPISVDQVYGGPEYETLAAFGSNCGISDPVAVCKAHELCNRHGIDTISAGATIAFAMECFEKGLLQTKDTERLKLRFGNPEAMLQVLEKMARKEGIGALLSEGSRIAAAGIPGGAEDLAMQVKGLELPMHDPRLKQGMGLHYSVNPSGPDHASGVHDTVMEKGPQFAEWAAMDANESIPSTELSPRKARLLYQYGLWTHLPNTLGLCLLVPYTKKQVVEAMEAITGWPMSYWRLMKAAERGITLAKIFNLREGFTARDDVLPARMAASQSGGNLEGVVVESERLEAAQKLYYQMLGWNEEGIPTMARLVELGMEWAAVHRPSSGSAS
jgi:aldehyde:ferredoxin oxidoreductase